jgi:hypothetical protein
MKRLRIDYHLSTSIIQLIPEIQLILCFKKVPHYITLQKFFKRKKSQIIDKIMDLTVELFDI